MTLTTDPDNPQRGLTFEPTLRYKALQWAKVIALVFVGLGVFVMSLVLRDLHNQNQRDQSSSECHGDVAGFHSVVTSELNALGWAALEANFTQDIQRRNEIALLVRNIVMTDIPRANELRLNVTEFCQDPPDNLDEILVMSVDTEAVTGRTPEDGVRRGPP